MNIGHIGWMLYGFLGGMVVMYITMKSELYHRKNSNE